MNQLHIELIEDLPLSPLEQWYIILVVLRKRSSMWAIMSSDIWRHGDDPIKIDPEKINRIKNSLNKLDIKYTIEFRDSDAGIIQPDDGRQRFNQICDIFIAQDVNTLDRLVNAIHDKNDIEIGHALGYPPTAVAAFNTDDKILVKRDLPPEIKYSEIGQLIKFTLSKNHWNDEIKIVQNWLDVLKSTSPIIYSECIKHYRTVNPETADRLIKTYQ